MTINILVSGPIRPDEESVIQVLETIRSQLPDSRIFFVSWSHSQRIQEIVDFYRVVPEPTADEITRIVTARTIQQAQLGLSDDIPGCKFSTFRMFYGVQQVCALASPYLTDSDIVFRIRTDSVLKTTAGYIEDLAKSNSYIAKRGDGFDWFAITTFDLFKKAWCFKDIFEYNECVSNSWNAEDIVFRRVPIPILYFDSTKVDCYILREGGRKHYYA